MDCGGRGRYNSLVMAFKAHVKNGRMILDEATDFPEGAEVELVPVDDLDAEDRRQLHAALDESEDDVEAGRVRPLADVLSDSRRS